METKIDAVAVLREALQGLINTPHSYSSGQEYWAECKRREDYARAEKAMRDTDAIAATSQIEDEGNAERAAIQPAIQSIADDLQFRKGLNDLIDARPLSVGNRQYELIEFIESYISGLRKDRQRLADELDAAVKAAIQPAGNLDIAIAIQALPCVHPGTVPQLMTAYEAGHRHALRQAAEYVERLAVPAAQQDAKAERAATVAKGSDQVDEEGLSIACQFGETCRCLSESNCVSESCRYYVPPTTIPPETKSEARAGACFVSGFSSRVCQLGTKSCTVNHPAEPSGSVGEDAEAKRLIGRLMSSDPNFADCTAAAKWIAARASQMEAAPRNAGVAVNQFRKLNAMQSQWQDFAGDGFAEFQDEYGDSFVYRTLYTAPLAIPCLPERAPEGWISVADRLPEVGQQVIVFTPNRKFGDCILFDTWDEQHEDPIGIGGPTICTGVQWNDHEFEDISHWQPLPAAPATPSPQGAENKNEGVK